MIKIYVHYREENCFTVMVIDNDMILHSDNVNEEDIDNVIEYLIETFSDTGRKVEVFR